jgi:hypothetical protein
MSTIVNLPVVLVAATGPNSRARRSACCSGIRTAGEYAWELAPYLEELVCGDRLQPL